MVFALDDFILSLMLFLLLAAALAPLALIVIGIVRRHKENGKSLFLIGAGLLSLLVAAEAAQLFSTQFVSLVVFFAVSISLFCGLQWLFKWITVYYGIKRKYRSWCLQMIRSAETPVLPSCESLLLEHIDATLSAKPEAQFHQLSQQAAETLVYRIALNFVDSDKLRTFNGLTDQGKQLLHICYHCLDHFLKSGYISSEEHAEHRQYLNDCDHHNDHYTFGTPRF